MEEPDKDIVSYVPAPVLYYGSAGALAFGYIRGMANQLDWAHCLGYGLFVTMIFIGVTLVVGN